MPARQYAGQAGPASAGCRPIRTPGGCWGGGKGVQGVPGCVSAPPSHAHPAGHPPRGAGGREAVLQSQWVVPAAAQPQPAGEGDRAPGECRRRGVAGGSSACTQLTLTGCSFLPAAGLLLFQLQRRPSEALLPECGSPRGKHPSHLQGEPIPPVMPKPLAWLP